MGTIIDTINQYTSDGELIHKSVKSVSFKKGQIILHAHQDSGYLHVIRDGLVKVYGINGRGEEAVSVIYGPGDMFPLTWIVLGRHKNAYFEAIADCEIDLLPQEVLVEQMKNSAAVSFAMARRVIEQFELYAARVNNLEFKYGRERLAYRLLLLGNRFGEAVGETIVLPRINQQDLAAMINVSRESLSREMSRFERLKLVEYTNTNIVLPNPDKLRDELGEDASVLFFDPGTIQQAGR